MNSIVLQVLLYAFVAGASPVALGATLVVLGSRARPVERSRVRDRRRARTADRAARSRTRSAPPRCPSAARARNGTRGARADVRNRAARRRRVRVVAATVDKPPKPNSRSKAVLARLARLSLPALFFAGAALTLGPKRLGAHAARDGDHLGRRSVGPRGDRADAPLRRRRDGAGVGAGRAGDRLRRPRRGVDDATCSRGSPRTGGR